MSTISTPELRDNFSTDGTTKFYNKPFEPGVTKGFFMKPRLIQRMSMESKNADIKFGDRFNNDYMGANEFERGMMRERLVELSKYNAIGQVLVHGIPTFVLFHPDRYDLAGVEYMLNRLYEGAYALDLREPIYFSAEHRKQWKDMKVSGATYTNAWFDIEHGLFWTMETINIADVRKNIRQSADYIREKAVEKAGQASLKKPLKIQHSKLDNVSLGKALDQASNVVTKQERYRPKPHQKHNARPKKDKPIRKVTGAALDMAVHRLNSHFHGLDRMNSHGRKA